MKRPGIPWFSLFIAILLLVSCGGQANTIQPEQVGSTPTPIPPTATPATTTESDTEPTQDTAPAQPTTDEASSEEATTILQRSLTAMAELDDYSATLDIGFEGVESGTVTMQVAMKEPPFGSNTEQSRPFFKGTILESTLDRMPAGTTAVLAPTSYQYDPEENVVIVREQEQGTGTSEVYNLYIGSQSRMLTLSSPEVADPVLAGEEQIGSFETTRITLEPRENVADQVLGPGASGSVWIDNETYLPVQFSYSQEDLSMQWTVHEIDLGELEDDDFTFTPPPESTIIHASDFGETVERDSIAEASRQVDVPVLTPDYLPSELPTQPSLIQTQQTPLGTMITWSYVITGEMDVEPPEGETSPPMQVNSLVIRVLPGTISLPRDKIGQVSDVTVRGNEGTLEEIGGNAILSWKEDDAVYTITGIGYGTDEVIKVAESLQ